MGPRQTNEQLERVEGTLLKEILECFSFSPTGQQIIPSNDFSYWKTPLLIKKTFGPITSSHMEENSW